MTKKTTRKSRYVTQAEFARIAGVRRQFVTSLIQRDKIAINEKRYVLIDDPKTKMWLDQYLVEKKRKQETITVEDPEQVAADAELEGVAKPLAVVKIEEEIARIKADRRLKELKYARERGELIERDRLGTVLFKYLDALNTNLLDVPDMVVDMLIDMIKAGKQRVEVAAYIRDAIHNEIKKTKKQIKNKLK